MIRAGSLGQARIGELGHDASRFARPVDEAEFALVEMPELTFAQVFTIRTGRAPDLSRGFGVFVLRIQVHDWKFGHSPVVWRVHFLRVSSVRFQ